MRATLSGYYRNLQFDQSNTARKLFDVTKQISSGQKIQYAYEDTSVFVDTVRLDNEVTTLTQAEQNAQKALQFSTNTDTTMNEMTKILDSMKTDLIYAANGVHSPESLNAIALELRGLEENLTQLANTSIDGKYLFSGTDVKTKPIDANGDYQGNDKDIFAHLGSGLEQKYNVSGADLFLGAENGTKRQVSTNISLKDATTGEYALTSTTLENITGSTANQFFYIRGVNSDGTSFNNKVSLPSTGTVDDILLAVKNSYKVNVDGSSTVDVTLDDRGAIIVTDKVSGVSKLDLHIVAGDDVSNIDNLVPTAGLEFMKSGLTATTVATGSESAIYDRTFFAKEGSIIQSNVSQIVKSGATDTNGNDIGNDFATDSTRLSDVFTPPLTTLHLEGEDLNGDTYNIDLDFTGVVVNVNGTYVNGGTAVNYDVANGNNVLATPADMTYKQLTDVINMAINLQAPTDSSTNYKASIDAANANSTVNLSHDGKITFEDKTNNPTLAEISIYDATTATFAAVGSTGSTAGSMATFNTNNALAISDPKTDFFKQIDDLITSVELGRINADGNSGDPRNLGVENSIQVIDDLLNHLGNQHAVAGTQSQTLERTVERTQLLLLTTQTLRSETLDVDIAEASLELKQLELNYQAMLSTVSRISQLSLVNYI